MSENSFRLADFIPYQMSIASNAVSNSVALAYRKAFGLKVTEWRVMAILGDSGDATQRELTSRTLMDKVAVNRACKSLEQRGLIARLPNPDDGRSHHLELSEEGVAMYAQIVPLALEVENKLLEPLSVQQRQVFQILLEKIRKQAG